MTDEESILDAITHIRNLLKGAKKTPRIVGLTGSGISKGSGIPTFRGKDGLWKNYNAMELATPQAFAQNPELVWEWYSWRIGLILEKEPNPAHFSLAKLEENQLLDWVITQNVDNLHHRAGSKNIIQVHGDIFRAWCMKCDYSEILSAAPETPPICSKCGTMLRPGVVWFGESLDYQTILNATRIVSEECDVMLVIGTSGIVYPVAAFPGEAKRSGAIVVEFNIESTSISQIADYSIFGKSEETLPAFVEGLLK